MSSTNITLTSGLELTSSLESGGSSVSTVAAAITYQTELSVSPSSCALECSIFDPASSNTESSASETPSTSSSSPAEPQPTSGTTGVSGGAVAGVAAGCLIAGTLIALIACFFLYRRQNRKRPVARPQLHPAYDSENKFGAAVLISPGLGAIRNPERTLPQPVEDAAITKEVSKIRDNIKNHVQTYYHFQPGPGGIQSSDLAALATATNLNETVIEAMLVGTSMRGDAIRLFIAWAILSRCETGRHPTLLPLGLESILETMARKNLRGSGKYLLTALAQC
ncbi:hypothetical protein BDW02DRAFT_40076 [Decorospora gaudefroyi]|uniref:Uncharacterized protein n=1 Tax=Decorospora gaudefroyi TaxID=184978 RepID=A0A6A5K4T3_9PLEO|nr:hypothetical protein BDW02DRAFT_40076 [Decorospora gaudefroyi]